MPDVGDSVTASVTVEPFDGSTLAALAVTAPDGTVTSPATGTSDGGKTWTSTVTYTAAGVWRLTWTVTGTGANVGHDLVSVAPAPTVTNTGRVYATTTQLAEYLEKAPPLDAAKLLRRASKLLDSDFLKAAMYAVDSDGMPTDAEVADGFAEAVCAQVEFWGEVGEENDISGPLQGVTIGSVSLQFGAGDNRSGPSFYAPKLMRALQSLPGDKFHPSVVMGGC